MMGKKLGLVLMGIVLMMTAACSIKTSDSIKEVYVEIVQQIEAGKSVELEYVKETLINYEYEVREVEGLKLHVFTNEQEVLSVGETETEITELFYEFVEDTKALALSYGKVANESSLFVHTEITNQKLNEQLAHILEVNETPFLAKYHEMNDLYLANPTFTITQLKELMKIEPNVYENPGIETTYYSFSSDYSEELIGAYTVKGAEEISRLTYAKLPELMRDTQKELLPSADRTYFHLSAQVNDSTVQKEVMDLFFKN